MPGGIDTCIPRNFVDPRRVSCNTQWKQRLHPWCPFLPEYHEMFSIFKDTSLNATQYRSFLSLTVFLTERLGNMYTETCSMLHRLKLRCDNCFAGFSYSTDGEYLNDTLKCRAHFCVIPLEYCHRRCRPPFVSLSPLRARFFLFLWFLTTFFICQSDHRVC